MKTIRAIKGLYGDTQKPILVIATAVATIEPVKYEDRWVLGLYDIRGASLGYVKTNASSREEALGKFENRYCE